MLKIECMESNCGWSTPLYPNDREGEVLDQAMAHAQIRKHINLRWVEVVYRPVVLDIATWERIKRRSRKDEATNTHSNEDS